LDRVSRSFAFCIRQLPEPLRDWVGLSYLLCRLVDTVEDSLWPDLQAQLAAFRAFDEGLLSVEGAHRLHHWGAGFPSDVVEGERLLLVDAETLLLDFHALPEAVRGVIRELVLSMSHGMQHFCRQRHGGQLRLHSLSEVNQYCFFVAGVVGELLANLVSRVEPRFRLSQLSLLRAHHFGQFLQKVNLLKDQVSDEKLGRHLVPSREQVEDSSQENAVQAFDFLLTVPAEQLEFRRFCAWSLFLGLEALSVARESLQRQQVLKVPREEMHNILEQVENALVDERALRSLFASFTHKLGWPKTTARLSPPQPPEWFCQVYRGPLSLESLGALGI
jgi:phytoene/squalene synthetase